MDHGTRAFGRAMHELMLASDPVEFAMAMEEFKSLRDESSDTDEPTAMVCAPLTPRPHLNSGAIALPEPDDE